MARIIPKRVLEDIRFRNDISEVIGSYFELKKAGSNFKALCPFHKEKTPSFHVNTQRQIYHCFGCGAGGDVFGFIMQYEGVPFVTAAKMLARRAGITLEVEEDDTGSSDKEALYDLHSKVAELYHKALLERESAAPARKHLEDRGITPETVEAFRIGYAPNRWDAVLTWARREKHKLEHVELAGLIMKKAGNGGDFYDRFRNRIMFPITDEQSRVIGFSGRTLDPDPKAAKYVNSPETPLFRKSRVLYALDKARRNIVESRQAIICEGQIDVIRCHQAGIDTAVAAQGTAFTDEHVQVLRRYADSVCVVFDQDKAGRDAAVKAATAFMAAGLAVTVGTLPKGEDPDSFIHRNGPDAFRAVIDKAGSAVAFQIESLSEIQDISSEIGAMRAAKAVLATISRSPNAVQRAKLVQEASERLRLPASALQDDLRHTLRNIRSRPAPGESRPSADDASERPPARAELELCEHLAHIADNAQLADLIPGYLPLDMIHHPRCRTFATAAIASFRKGNTIQEELDEQGDPSPELQRFAAQVQMSPNKIRGTESSHEAAVQDLILYIWRRKLKHDRSQLERKLEAGPNTDVEHQLRQITIDIKSLGNWETGSAVIEIHLAEED